MKAVAIKDVFWTENVGTCWNNCNLAGCLARLATNFARGPSLLTTQIVRNIDGYPVLHTVHTNNDA